MPDHRSGPWGLAAALPALAEAEVSRRHMIAAPRIHYLQLTDAGVTAVAGGRRPALLLTDAFDGWIDSIERIGIGSPFAGKAVGVHARKAAVGARRPKAAAATPGLPSRLQVRPDPERESERQSLASSERREPLARGLGP